jgi:mono/diheme cytochrome c family protein
MKKIQPIRSTNGLRAIVVAPMLLIIAVFFVTTLSCSSTQQGKSLFEAKCAECHPLDYAFREKKSLAEWNKTTETMARYSEGSITKDEAKKIAKYLANVHP